LSNSVVKYLFVGASSVALLSLVASSNARVRPFRRVYERQQFNPPADTPKTKKAKPLRYKFKDNSNEVPQANPSSGGVILKDPSNLVTNVEYDPVLGKYLVTQKIGGIDYRPPTYMTSDEYQKYMFKKQEKDYWGVRTHADSKSPAASASPALPKLKVGGEIFDRIFGGNTVSIIPNGSAQLDLGYIGNKTQNPSIPQKQRSVGSMNFDEKIQLNVIGKIGDKLKITTSYNTQATFDFENQMKLDYTGYDDEIIKKIEAGNVNFPLKGSLISGSQTLFGVKTQLQFGRLTATSVIAQEKGATSEVQVAGGSQTSNFILSADSYDANRHYFLGQYFRDQYNTALAGLPFVNSQVSITRIEVWVTNTNSSTTNIRSVLGLGDLAEDITHVTPSQQSFITDKDATVLPFNNQNSLYGELIADSATIRNPSTTIAGLSALSAGKMQQQTNYELVSSARLLNSSEYTFNPLLGYLSLKQQLTPVQALCVAYQYTLNGKVYQVGEFSDGGISAPQSLIAKMLKATAINTALPMWDLMMKNIYAIGAYQIQQQNFRMDVLYTNKQTGTDINYLPVSECQTAVKARPLLQVLRLDRLNQQNDVQPDGLFDFIDGVTVNSSSGLIMFPVTEPFGSYLTSKFDATCSTTEYAGYAFPQLYDSTQTIAKQYFPQLDRFKLRGQYQSSSSSEINLGAPNVAKGSVVVTAGGVVLTENTDYTVDYTLGRVKIINDGILNSGTPISVKSGSNALFNVQQKRILGTHLDYRINKDFTVGGTAMNLTERPLNNKVNIGYEPVSNTVLGLDANFKTEAPFLTRFVDKLPFYNTKAPSSITASGEYAYLIPGFNKGIGSTGTSYVDDFESTQSTIDLRPQNAWVLASTPQGQPNLFPEASQSDSSLRSGYNRAKLAWYTLSPEMIRQTPGITPANITNADMSNNFVREVLETEIFPNEQLSNGVPPNISMLDLAYYPSEVGPYNFDAAPTNVSSGLDVNGNLKNPTTRWAGMMRALQTNDFQAANVEYIQFWVMDPFNADNTNPSSTGDLYFNLGNVSEDILNDGQRSSENGLPTPITAANTIPTVWGQVPAVQPLLNTFNADPTERPYQDVGFDGLANTLALGGEQTEQSHYTAYLNSLQSIVSSAVYSSFSSDPSHDDFHYFRGTDYDNANLKTLERYKQFNGMENNSRTTSQSPESYPTASSQTPNVEDINSDNILSTSESYYQYHISLKPSDFTAGVGNNYITSVFTTTGANIKDGTTKPIKWYQFKIPVLSPEKVVGDINNFQSIRFMRMFIKGADKPLVLRFGRLELVRADWRKYQSDLSQPGLYVPNDVDETTFDVGAVNLQENGGKQPVNYIIPPGITRQVGYGTTNTILLNEQSLDLNVCNLKDGDARGAFKSSSLDVRSYKKLQMFIHGEAVTNSLYKLKDDDLTVFVRLGTDYVDNYYEYEIPLKLTPPGSYDGTNLNDQVKVWPEANDMVLEFSTLEAAKQQRNLSLGSTNAQLYITTDGTRKITVKGNPNLAAVKILMIGIRNPKKTVAGDSDDGLPKCAQVWVDELRLTDFITNGGGAANASVTAQLADLGSISATGNYYGPGWGSIQNKISDRKREELIQYNLTSSLELGKFLPENANIKIPMYVGYGETYITPQYDPLAPDLILKDELKTLPKPQQDSLKNIVIDYTRRKNINFSNVKKNKGKDAKKSHIYDIENWSVSAGYSEVFKRSINVEYNVTKNYKGSLVYGYAPSPKNITPFSKINLFKPKYLQLLRDFNFFPYPNQIGFSTDVNRDFSSYKYRDVTAGELLITPLYNKKINWMRNYSLGYPITKDLKVDFTASNTSRVLEPNGLIDTQAKKDTIINNFKNLGSTTLYNSQFNANYNIPINKFPLLDFTKASVKYTGTYNWTRAPFNADTLGNTIQNSQVIAWTGDLNLTTLYNKVPFIKRALLPINKTVKPPKIKSPNDTTKKHKTIKITDPIRYFVRVLTSVKNVNLTYGVNRGTILPGYKDSTFMMGMNHNFAGPTPGFVFGSQKDIRQTAIDNDWLVKTQSINTPYSNTYSQNFNARSNIEPLPNLKIELTETWTKSQSLSEFFRWNRDSAQYVHQSTMETGNFSMSFLSFGTSFANGDVVFQKFLADRQTVSGRLGALNSNSKDSTIEGYAKGYNQTSQDVLIPSFIAAYSGQGANKVTLDNFPKIPKPNWRVTYDGLTKIEQIKRLFKTVVLSHAYKSTYNIGGYTSNLLYQQDANGNANGFQTVSSIANNPNFYPKNSISTVSITESWSPLAKVDVTLYNSMLANITFNKDRAVSLSVTNKSITEILGREIIIGTGYRIKDVPLGNLKIAGKPIRSDLNLIGNVSIRRNQTIIRRIEEESSQSTAGTSIISLNLSADYTISQKLTIRLYYGLIVNHPLISNSFPTSNTNAGVSLRLSLSG
jgi:cell surface protein SprA